MIVIRAKQFRWVLITTYIFIGIVADAEAAFADKSAQISTTSHLPLGLPNPRADNGFDPALAQFGAFLFTSTALSRDESLSCRSCHVLSEALSGSSRASMGLAGTLSNRHAPALQNLYLSKAFMWDGRARDLKNQVRIPLENHNEMAIRWPSALRRLAGSPEALTFMARSHIKTLNRDAILAALAMYLNTLVSGDSPFDRYYYGGEANAISEDAKEGFRLFVYKGNCATCHLVTGDAAPFTDGGFHSIGIGYKDGRYQDDGRADVTSKTADLGLFKTPSLRNVGQRHYFMHDGSLDTLREVLKFYNRGGGQGARNLDPRLRPLFLNDHEIDQMLIFLLTLSSPIKSFEPVRH